jgi:hypothetical protein
MPRGKELEQLPMSNIAPGTGMDQTPIDREVLSGGGIDEERPHPSKAGQNQTKKQ